MIILSDIVSKTICGGSLLYGRLGSFPRGHLWENITTRMFPSILQAPLGGQLSGIVGMDGLWRRSPILQKVTWIPANFSDIDCNQPVVSAVTSNQFDFEREWIGMSLTQP